MESAQSSESCVAEVPPGAAAEVPPGWHRCAVGGMTFLMESRFTPRGKLGHGAYGVVCSAAVQGEEDLVAIKRMPGIFDETKGILGEAKRALREILLLRHLQHDNVLCLRHLMLPPGRFDVYLVTELMDTDLSCVIASPEPLTDDHCQYFAYQLLYVPSSSAGTLDPQAFPASTILFFPRSEGEGLLTRLLTD